MVMRFYLSLPQDAMKQTPPVQKTPEPLPCDTLAARTRLLFRLIWIALDTEVVLDN